MPVMRECARVGSAHVISFLYFSACAHNRRMDNGTSFG